MRILVCFQVTADLETLSESDWVCGKAFAVDLSFAKIGLNCYDESALELALRIADQRREQGLPCSLTAISMGDFRAKQWLKTLCALGFDRCVLLEQPEDWRFAPEEAARALVSRIQEEQAELVLMGRQSEPGNNGQVPSFAAELLGWPCITGVESVDARETALAVSAVSGRWRARRVMMAPAVLAVGNAPSAFLRVPTLRDRIASGQKEISTGQTARQTAVEYRRLTGLRPIDRKRQGVILSGESAEALARQLYDLYLKERLVQ